MNINLKTAQSPLTLSVIIANLTQKPVLYLQLDTSTACAARADELSDLPLSLISCAWYDGAGQGTLILDSSKVAEDLARKISSGDFSLPRRTSLGVRIMIVWPQNEDKQKTFAMIQPMKKERQWEYFDHFESAEKKFVSLV